jgi:hypothetical protein
MLSYLEELCSALLSHDATAVHRLLAQPLAQKLPRVVRDEALALSRAGPTTLRAPIHTLRYYYQTLQLTESEPPTRAGSAESADHSCEQIELVL